MNRRLAHLGIAQGWRCYYCRVPTLPPSLCERTIAKMLNVSRTEARQRTASIDHVVPKSRGGTNARMNLVLACRRCNALKGSKTLDEFLQR